MPPLGRTLGQTGGASYNRAALAHIAHAKTICADCPVLEPCRAWALTRPDPCEALVAGGFTPAERTIRRRA
jgi:hypothetical protein